MGDALLCTHLRMLDSLDRESIYSKTQRMPRVQKPQVASKREGRGLEMADTHCFSIWIQQRIHRPALRKCATRESDAPRRGSGLGLDRMFLPCVRGEKRMGIKHDGGARVEYLSAVLGANRERQVI
jgi:hypothetical protein